MESNEFVPSMPDLREAGPRSRLNQTEIVQVLDSLFTFTFSETINVEFLSNHNAIFWVN